MRACITLVLTALAAAATPSAIRTVSLHAHQERSPGPAPCRVCSWLPPATKRTVSVGSVDQLVRAVREARPSTTILLEEGEYRLPHFLDMPTSDVVLRSRSGRRDGVILRGGGVGEQQVGVALSVSAPRVTIADLTVGYVAYHGVQVHGELGAANFTLHNARIVDTGQQLLKVTVSRARQADDGLVACSLLEYSDHAPSSYTNGVDALGTRGWTVRDSRFVRIKGPEEQRHSAGPAILFWANAIDTIVERNVIVDSFRGIAFGLLAEAQELARPGEGGFDHRGGVIRNNVVCNLQPWGDEGIEANASNDVRIDHNTVLVEGSLSWSISTRFPRTSARVRNNLTSREILRRDAGQADTQGNVSGARRAWFVDTAACDLRLTPEGAAAISGTVPVPDITDDLLRLPRSTGTPTAGAFERSRAPQ